MTTNEDFADVWDEQVPPDAAERALQDRLTHLQQQSELDSLEPLDDFLDGFENDNFDLQD